MKTLRVLELFGNAIEIEKKGETFRVSEPDYGDFSVEADEAMQAKIVELILGESFLLTSRQAEAVLGVCYATLHRMTENNELTTHGHGKRNFYDVKEVLRVKNGLPARELEADSEEEE